MKIIFILIAIITLILMIKKHSKGGLLEWLFIIIGFVAVIS